ncbi:hypothetical protein HNR42_000159 [Deinobacterium chartae]|uniref:NlpC/P60 domain-containing protein n=1 Tax=Deinobacterium chartae TaxID=521158 RepID=A0A841HTR7_9DEIO|nr:hypothetical protein [Deinobacterium chartae]
MKLDRRTHAFDEGRRRAEPALRGQLEGEWSWLETPRRGVAARGRVSLRARPQSEAPQVTEALLGEAVEILEDLGEWVWVRTLHDRYLGYARRAEVLLGGFENAVSVKALRGHVYDAPRVQGGIIAEIARGACLRVLREEGEWREVALPDGRRGFVSAAVFDEVATDPLEFGQLLLGTPYVWGGRSAWGIDCSGLSQRVYAFWGRSIPRDADQQQAFLEPVNTPQPGDLAFFPGHVAVCLGEGRILHATSTYMRVAINTLGEGEYGQRLEAALTGYGRWRDA